VPSSGRTGRPYSARRTIHNPKSLHNDHPQALSSRGVYDEGLPLSRALGRVLPRVEGHDVPRLRRSTPHPRRRSSIGGDNGSTVGRPQGLSPRKTAVHVTALERESESAGALSGSEEDIDDDVLVNLLSASWPTLAVVDDKYGRYPWTPLGGRLSNNALTRSTAVV